MSIKDLGIQVTDEVHCLALFVQAIRRSTAVGPFVAMEDQDGAHVVSPAGHRLATLQGTWSRCVPMIVAMLNDDDGGGSP